MSDTTERPPAREVIARDLCFRMDGIHGKTCCKCKSPADCRDWDARAFKFRENADAHLTALAAAGYPVEAMHAQLADIEEHGTAEINHAVALRGLLVEAICLLRVIGDAADGPAGQKFPVTVQNGRHLTANHVAKCADLVGRARDAVSTTPPSVAAGPALVEALETASYYCGHMRKVHVAQIEAALALAKQEPQP